jgi:tRNA 2-selenouridine synthase
VALHGRERIEQWKALGAAHDWVALVERLLTEHYDPAYLRGMPRNYAGYEAAENVRVAELSDAAFSAAAQELIAVT